MRSRFLIIPVLCAAIAPGCSKGPSVKTIPVTGTVTYAGAALEGATVTFVNADPDGRSASGVTDAQGKFKLITLVTPGRQQDGAVAGDYVATVVKTEGTQAESMQGIDAEKLKGKSPEEMRMMRGPPKQPDMSSTTKAEPPKPKSLVPEKYSSPKDSDLKVTVSATNHEFTLELKD